MNDPQTALAAAREPLLAFHQSLIQAERRQYEAAHGPIAPARFLGELMNGSSFLWLKPLTALLLTIDERLEDASSTPESFTEAADRLRQVLKDTAPGGVVEHLAALRTAFPELTALQNAVLQALGAP